MTTTLPPLHASSALSTDEMPFSQVLRESTQRAHTAAESSSFVDRLLAGELDAAAFARLMAQLYPVYEAMECSSANDSVRDRFDDPRLHRLAVLEHDLATLIGPDWRTAEPVLPAARAYAEHVASVSGSTPAFVGHHYTRYLGDLSGGLAIARRVAQHYGLREGEPGLLFYRFDGIPKPKLFKDDYRRALDTAPWGPVERGEVVAEAERAFAMNAAIFAALG
ncbi:heme oxygenase (biliverdin-producing) [Pseudactinotalea suaedae]|uniref:biliverdin-producing heme oxygenase n=1 Tax=Pseudactinotalea suaedae TaxID=1524924 RepID=UPI0012E28C67|nr:biliverdin-producing heme oxygenase [Pseudactinotalea suaedae]